VVSTYPTEESIIDYSFLVAGTNVDFRYQQARWRVSQAAGLLNVRGRRVVVLRRANIQAIQLRVTITSRKKHTRRKLVDGQPSF
jgi:hypothetical protein